MQEVIAKIAELQDLLKQKLVKAEALIKDNENYRDSLKARELKVGEREARVIPAEKVEQAKADVLRESKILEEGNRKLSQDKQNWENSKSKELENLAKMKQERDIEQSKIDAANKTITQEWAALNKEKAEYKEKILADLKNLVK